MESKRLLLRTVSFVLISTKAINSHLLSLHFGHKASESLQPGGPTKHMHVGEVVWRAAAALALACSFDLGPIDAHM